MKATTRSRLLTTVLALGTLAPAGPSAALGASSTVDSRMRLDWQVGTGHGGRPLIQGHVYNDYGRPAINFGFEFLRVFGIAVGIGVALIVIGALVRIAARFDMQLINALSRHADLDRHR